MDPAAVPLVVGVGEVLWDRFPDGDRLGGAPANFAFHARQLGARARIVSRVGRDPEGDRLTAQLSKEGMDLTGLQRDPRHPTGTVRVQLHEGQPTYTIVTDAAWDFLEMTAELKALAAQTDAVCFGTLAQRHPVARETVQEFVRQCPAGSLRILTSTFDYPFTTTAVIEFGLKHADVLKLNADELARITEIFGWKADSTSAMSLLFENYPLYTIALTKGAAGCEVRLAGKRSNRRRRRWPAATRWVRETPFPLAPGHGPAARPTAAGGGRLGQSDRRLCRQSGRSHVRTSPRTRRRLTTAPGVRV